MNPPPGCRDRREVSVRKVRKVRPMGAPSGMKVPLLTRAARSASGMHLPLSESPSRRVIFPRGIHPGHSHWTVAPARWPKLIEAMRVGAGEVDMMILSDELVTNLY
jgi:hypothetical protein